VPCPSAQATNTTQLFVSLIADSPFPFPAIRQQLEPSEGHPFVFIDFGHLGSCKNLNALILNRLWTPCARIPGVSPQLSRLSFFTHFLPNKSCICHSFVKWCGYTQTLLLHPICTELYFPLAPVRDSPLVAQALACALRLHNSQESPQ
jgi:hypothetical protein